MFPPIKMFLRPFKVCLLFFFFLSKKESYDVKVVPSGTKCVLSSVVCVLHLCGTVSCLQYRNDWCWLGESSTCNAKPGPEFPSTDLQGIPGTAGLAMEVVASLGSAGAHRGWNSPIASLAALGEHLCDAVWPCHFKLSLN